MMAASRPSIGRPPRAISSSATSGGPREFYEGSLARDIADDLQAGGSAISYDDLKAYEARIVEPLSFEHHGVTINVAGGLTAGPTLKRALELMGERTKG